jgi:isopenicillin N synthase-like dioxygenase
MRFSLIALMMVFGNTNLMAEQLDVRIPVLDMQDYYDQKNRTGFLDTLYEAMTTVGFFAVRNSKVDAEVIRLAYAQAEEFFKQDIGCKALCFDNDLHGQRGFVPGEVAKGNKLKDRKEFYHIGSEKGAPKNIWPSKPGFREALSHLYDELEKYVIPLQRAIVETINQRATESIDPNYLNAMTANKDSLLRALYYPALATHEVDVYQPPVYWAAAHTDIDLLAILPYATEKGLQVEVDGQWLNVIVPEDALIINVGDMLKNISNGLFVSARHRVVAQDTNKERFSTVFFVHPFDEASLDPHPACIELTGGSQTYAPGTRMEFLFERLLELNIGSPTLLEIYSKTGHAERQMQYHRESPQVIELLVNNRLASPELLQMLEKRKAAGE